MVALIFSSGILILVILVLVEMFFPGLIDVIPECFSDLNRKRKKKRLAKRTSRDEIFATFLDSVRQVSSRNISKGLEKDVRYHIENGFKFSSRKEEFSPERCLKHVQENFYFPTTKSLLLQNTSSAARDILGKLSASEKQECLEARWLGVYDFIVETEKEIRATEEAKKNSLRIATRTSQARRELDKDPYEEEFKKLEA